MKTLKFTLTRALTPLAIFAAFAIVISFWASEVRSAVTAFSVGEKAYISTAGTGNFQAPGQATATTSVVYLSTSATASSTIVGSLNGADTLVLNVQSNASSSLPANATKLQISIDVSNDGVDWYQWAQNATTTLAASGAIVGDTFYYSREIVHQWSVSTTTQTGNVAKKQFVFQGLYGLKYRVRLSTAGSNQALWAEAYPIIPTPR